ncbi:transcriptional regulator [Streptococcus suis]|uniref:helix-turn-helix domain-containing protein n=3 Tax=Streptococcus suis TaxID=1307 RepID=UPI00076952AA|nr:Rgg/GadR/MutR family transcriptional regulator [Streptococcus suis]CYY36866.1 transcriptional regulator [Streptococcus suis]CYZ46117.1 transcriptional regulator [Streptococcus suis]
MSCFGKTLKFIREGKGKSLAEVAKGHISTSQLSRFENGESDITVSKLFGVLAEMNVDVDEFVYASQDFKKDELTRILEQLKQSIYIRDVVTIKKILSEQLAKAERDSRREFHRLNAILIAYKLRNLDKTIVVSKEDTAFLTDYLFRVENWSYYEILLFANTIDKLGHQTMMLFLPFVKFIKVFDEKYFVSRHPNKEIVLFWTKVTCKKCIQNQHLMLKFFDKVLQ